MNPLNKTEPWSYRYNGTNSGYDYRIGNFTQSSSGLQASGVSTVIGSANPGWRDQIKAGVNATTPFSGVKYHSDVNWATAEVNVYNGFPVQAVSQVWGGSLIYPVYMAPPAFSPSQISDATNRCIRKFIADCNKATSSDNLTGRSIKHLQHDLHTIIHPMDGIKSEISKYLSALEKGSRSLSKKYSPWLNLIRNEYLKFVFGVKPFTDDIEAIISGALITKYPSQPVQGTGKTVANSGPVSFNYNMSSNAGFTLGVVSGVYNVTSVYSVKMKGAIRTNAHNGKVGFFQSQRLLPQDWLPTAFSIMPYAWMVNYFTNVGDIVDALSFPFSSLAWGCENVKQTNTVTYSDCSVDYNPGTTSPPWVHVSKGGGGGSATFTYETINRTALLPPDLLPSFEIHIPTSPQKWVNMMAAFSPRISSLVSRVL